MLRTLVRRAGQESASLQAVVPWCSSCNGLVRRIGMCAGEANYFRYYKRLGVIAKLATSYRLGPSWLRHASGGLRFQRHLTRPTDQDHLWLRPGVEPAVWAGVVRAHPAFPHRLPLPRGMRRRSI